MPVYEEHTSVILVLWVLSRPINEVKAFEKTLRGYLSNLISPYIINITY